MENLKENSGILLVSNEKNWATFYYITRKTFEKSEILFVNNLENLREKVRCFLLNNVENLRENSGILFVNNEKNGITLKI